MDNSASTSAQSRQGNTPTTYEKRSGTAGHHGLDFELYLSMLFLLHGQKLIQEGEIDSFHLATNVSKVAALDDVVYRSDFREKTGEVKSRIMFLQAKHKEQSKAVVNFLVTSKNKDFALGKYFKSYLEIKQQFESKINDNHPFFRNFKDTEFIIYTNALFVRKTMCYFSDTYVDCDSIWFLNSRPNCFYQFKFADQDILSEIINFLKDSLPDISVNKDDVEEFLTKLKIFVGQPDKNSLANIIKIKLESLYNLNETVSDLFFTSLQQKIKIWWEERNVFLTENCDLINEIHQHLSKLNNYQNLVALMKTNIEKIKELKLTFKKFQLKRFESSLRNARILHIVTNNNTVSLNTSKLYQVLQNMDKKQTKQEKEESKQETDQFQYLFISLSEALILQTEVIDMFHTKANCLIIVCEDTEKSVDDLYDHLSSIIENNDNKTIVLLAEENNPFTNKFSINNHFKKLLKSKVHLNNFTIKTQEIFLKRDILFQAELISLDMMIDKKSRHLIGAQDLFKLINNETICIGKAPDECEDNSFFIEPELKLYKTVKHQVFKDTSLNDLYAFSNIKKEQLILLTNYKMVHEFNYNHPHVENFKYIILGDVQKEKDFNRLCEYNDKKNIHWIERKNDNFVWVKSRGSLASFRQFVDENCIENYKVSEIKDKIAIIQGEPGMGKTTLLQKLSQNSEKPNASCWVERINLFDHTKVLDAMNDINENVVLNFLSAGLQTTLEKSLFKLTLQKIGNTIIYMDGFDEINPTYSEKVCKIIEILQGLKIKQLFITTRPYAANALEDRLNLMSYYLMPLSRNQQIQFLINFWKKKLDLKSDDQTRKDIDNILNAQFFSDRENEFTEIPLHLRMFAEIYLDKLSTFQNIEPEAHDCQLPIILDQFDLYGQFVDKKFYIHCKEKLRQDITNPAVKEDQEESRKNFIYKHQLLAFSALFSYGESEELPFEKNKLEEIKEAVKRGSFRTGIVNKIDNNKPIFIHRTFTEYFAAGFLALNMNIQRIQNVLSEILFKPEYELIRYFFDRFMIKNEHNINDCEIHEAVLSRNNSVLETLLNINNINKTDKGGRTALHLAASYGCGDIVDMLLHHECDVNISDSIFGWSPLLYALRYENWIITELLLQGDASSENINQVLSNVEEKRYNAAGYTLLHIAAREGYAELARLLIHTRFINVDVKNYYNETPLHLAAVKGQLELVRLLINQGADINAGAIFNMTPLHRAAEEGNLPTVQYLVGKNANVDARDSNDETALHWAVITNHLTVASFLVERGCDINAHDIYGQTPLHWAAHGDKTSYFFISITKQNTRIVSLRLYNNITGSIPIFKCFVEYNANMAHSYDHLSYDYDIQYDNKCNLNGQICTDKAAFNITKGSLMKEAKTNIFIIINEPTFKILIDHNVKSCIPLTNESGRAPRNTGTAAKQLAIVQFLVEKGADINIQDNSKYTALDYATICNNTDVIEYLQEIDHNFIQYAIPRNINSNMDLLERIRRTKETSLQLAIDPIKFRCDLCVNCDPTEMFVKFDHGAIANPRELAGVPDNPMMKFELEMLPRQMV